MRTFKTCNVKWAWLTLLFYVVWAGACRPPEKSKEPKARKSKRPRTQPKPSREEARESVPPPGPRPPSGPNLAPMQVLEVEVDPPRRIAASLGKLLPTSVVPSESMEKAVVEIFFRFFGLKGVETGVDPSRGLRMSLVTSLTSFGMTDILQLLRNRGREVSSLMPVLVARVPVKGNGEALLSALSQGARQSSSTAWGGHVFKTKDSTVWVHLKKSWAVLATRENHLSPAWKLFKAHNSSASSSGVRIRTPLKRLHPFLKTISTLSRYLRSHKKYGKFVSSLNLVLGVAREMEVGTFEMKAIGKGGVSFKLGAEVLKGAMRTWSKALSTPRKEWIQTVPRGAAAAYVSSVPRSERLYWMASLKGLWRLVLYSTKGVSGSTRDAACSRLSLVTDAWAKALGDKELVSLFFEPKGSPGVLLVSSLDNSKLFLKAMGKAVELVKKDIPLVWKKLKVKKRSRRVNRMRVHQATLSWPDPIQRKVPKMGALDFLFMGRVVVSYAVVDGLAMVHLGSGSTKVLKRLMARIRNRKKKRGRSGAPGVVVRALERMRAKGAVSMAGVSGVAFIKGLSALLVKRTPQVTKMMKVGRTKKGRRLRSSLIALVKKKLSEMSTLFKKVLGVTKDETALEFEGRVQGDDYSMETRITRGGFKIFGGLVKTLEQWKSGGEKRP